jgi:hypothetical protein
MSGNSHYEKPVLKEHTKTCFHNVSYGSLIQNRFGGCSWHKAAKINIRTNKKGKLNTLQKVTKAEAFPKKWQRRAHGPLSIRSMAEEKKVVQDKGIIHN